MTVVPIASPRSNPSTITDSVAKIFFSSSGLNLGVLGAKV